MFEPGTDAAMTLPGRRRCSRSATSTCARPSTRSARRATRRCPATCRRRSAYTYAVEFSVDEAVEAGATDVRFTKPVATYVENFLGFAAGTLVPAAYYDEAEGDVGAVRQRRRDRCAPRAASTSRATATRTTRRGPSMTKSGIDAAERGQARGAVPRRQEPVARRRSGTSRPGTTTGPTAARPTATRRRLDPPPPAFCPECQAAGSIIGVFNQTLGERAARRRHAVLAALRVRPRARATRRRTG